MLTSEELSRFESLGNNCEIGFVLRELGSEEGGFFRWIAIDSDAVASMIEHDLEGVFQFENLVPHSDLMVRDSVHGGAYHTKMVSKEYPAGRRFLAPDGARQEVYAVEAAKAYYLKEKFLERLDMPGLIYVVKREEGVSTEGIARLNAALSAKRRGSPFMILHIVPVGNRAEAGKIRHMHSNVVEGYVNWIAPWDATDKADFKNWASVLRHAVAIDVGALCSQSALAAV